MITSAKNRHLVRKLGAITSAEHYLIARTHQELRTARADAGKSQGSVPLMFATSATCMIFMFVLMQVWPHIANSTST